MFGLLKAKLSGFVDRLTGREEKKEAAPAPAQIQKPEAEPPKKREPGFIEEKKAEEKNELIFEKKEVVAPQKETVPQKKPELKKQEPRAEAKPPPVAMSAPMPKQEERPPQKKPGPKAEIKPEPRPEQTAEIKQAPKPEQTAEIKQAPKPEQTAEIKQVPKPEQKIEVKQEPKAQTKPTFPPISPTSDPQKSGEQPKEEKKDFLSSIWPFSKHEKQKEDAFEKPPAPVQVPLSPASKTSSPSPAPPSSPAPSSSAEPLDPGGLERLGKKALSEQEREMKVKLGLGKNIATLFSGTVTITEDDVRDLVDDLELSLLESDVAYEVSLEVAASLKKQLVGMKVPKGAMHEKVNETLQTVLTQIMTSNSHFDFFERVAGLPKPAKILFIGPNGAGKTTTMAKIAHQLKARHLTSVLSASDTFRAAAIEQAEVHASRLGIPIIKSAYGADPASVAFDAIKYAKSHQIDVVLIDSAGRQDTNQNLIDELRKIDRVIKPDLKIYIGESIGGNALVGQVAGFHKAVGIDGAILTKLDCDAKGGTAISLAKATGVPILFLGTGQGYDDLIPFDADEIARRILT